MRYAIIFLIATALLYATDEFGRIGPFGPAWNWDTKSQAVYLAIIAVCFVVIYVAVLLCSTGSLGGTKDRGGTRIRGNDRVPRTE